MTFTLLNNNASATFVGGDNDCVTIADGTCSIQITADQAGSVEIRARRR